MKKSKKSIIISAITIIALCFSIMVGGTYAWFTSTVRSDVCKVEAGTLKVVLEMKDNNGNWVDANGKTLMFKVAGEIPSDPNQKIWWEPGATYELPTLRVRNDGNLALKYKVEITGIRGDAKLNEVIDWTIGSNAVGEYTLLPSDEAKEFTITGYMHKDAGNEYQGMSIEGIGITVYATQVSYEKDSKDDTYDQDADYITELPDGKTFTDGTHTVSVGIIASNPNAVAVKASGVNTTVTITGGTFDGGKGGNNQCVQASNGATVVIKDGTFTVGGDANGEGNSVVYSNGGNIVIEGGVFKTEYQYGGRYYVLNQNNGNPGTITVKGGKFYKYDPSTGDDNLGGNFVAEGYTVVKVGDWYEVVKKDGANIEVVKEDNATVTVSEDLKLSNVITISESKVTLDATGKTITNTTDLWNEGKGAWSLVSAREGTDLTVAGGEFKAKENDCYAVDVQDGATVTIKDGTFIGNIHAVYVYEGTAIIEGGFYSVQQKYPDANKANEFVLNCRDDNRANGTAKIIVKGGTFVNFNPADCWAEGAHTNFVAEGYKVVSETKENGDVWYIVVAE